MNKAVAIASMLFCAAFAWSEPLPVFRLNSLSGHAVTLPSAARGHAAILIIGFTSGSAKASSAWRQRIDKELGSSTGLIVYDIAILEDVPRLVRGFVVGSIRKGTPAPRQDTFLTTFQDEKAWKQVVGYSEKDDSYLVILNSDGAILWQMHGICTDAEFATFREHARVLHLN